MSDTRVHNMHFLMLTFSSNGLTCTLNMMQLLCAIMTHLYTGSGENHCLRPWSLNVSHCRKSWNYNK